MSAKWAEEAHRQGRLQACALVLAEIDRLGAGLASQTMAEDAADILARLRGFVRGINREPTTAGDET